MRTLKKLIRWAGALALVLLAFSPLVRGPEEETPPQAEVPAGPTAVYAPEAVDMPLQADAPPRAREERLRETAAAPVRLTAPKPLPSDRNGHPLQAATWSASHYPARPPESRFG